MKAKYKSGTFELRAVRHDEKACLAKAESQGNASLLSLIAVLARLAILNRPCVEKGALAVPVLFWSKLQLTWQ